MRGTFIHCWWEYKLTDTMEISAVVSQEDGSQDPAIPLLGIYPKEASFYHRDTCSTIFTVALFIIARN